MNNSSSHGRGEISYRPDIDGLRAISVLAVIAFHMGVQVVDGGFIGVDIFFVISGYLISSKVLTDIENNNFSLSDFYLRRIKRIFPALAAMMLITTIVALSIEFPVNLVAYSKSIIASVLSISNIYFFFATDYFAPQARTALLLHTWSLSVEEQFYLFFPPVMLILFKWRGRLSAGIWIILIISLIASSIVAFTASVSAFYLPQYRIWELLAGTAVTRYRVAVLDRARAREAVAGLGLMLVIGSIFLLGPKMVFPGLLAVPGCLGAALLIAAGKHGQTFVGRMLGLPLARGIGLISYSLYLWHWPIIVFYKNWKPVQLLSLTDKVVLAAVILAIAIISWRFVEQPFRRSRRSPRWVFGSAGAVAGVLIATGGISVWAAGFPTRFSAREQKLVGYLDDQAPARDKGCFGGSRGSFANFDAGKCLASDTSRPNILLLGDSHANHLWLGLSHHSGANVMELTARSCVPTMANKNSRDPLCAATTKYAFQAIPKLHPDLIVLAGRWQKNDLGALEKTIDWLDQHGQRVIVSGPIVEYDAELPRLLLFAERRHQPGLWEKHLVPGRLEIDRKLAAVARRKGVAYLSPLSTLCPVYPHCRVLTPGGAAMQSDYGHLTAEGSDYLVGTMLHGRPIMDALRR